MVRTTGGLEGTMNVLGVIVLALTTLAAITVVESAVIPDNGCTVSINYLNGDLKEPQPLILKNGKNGTTFYYPIDTKGTIKFETGQKILFACPGQGNKIKGINGLKNSNEIEANCLRGKTFSFASLRFNFTTVSCKFLPIYVARRTNNRCYGNATHVDIGFALKNEFIRTIEICRDDKTMMTYWSKFRLTSNIDGHQSGFPRPKWKVGNFYGKYNIEKYYMSREQVGTIEKQVGSKTLANKYINAAANYFMARGHLTAKSDFVYGSAQSSTFWYLNAAPQWQTFNGGNWNNLENSVRQYTAKRNSDLEVYTGTYGHMSLTDVNGNEVPIYLYVNGTTKAFPVPKFYWKVIYDPVAKKATSFVGVNDPWAKTITNDMFICNDIADKIKWLEWQPKNIVKGVSYVCNVDDLRKSVPYIPELSISDILT